jgi:nucleotide-binding universal stress UspA family protein
MMNDVSAKRILVPVNGNPTDDEVVALASSLATRNRAEVNVIYVIEVKRTLPLDADLPPEAERGETILASAERVANSSRQEIQADLLQAREGDVGPTIVDEARERGADLILLGIPYKKRFGEFDLGRTVPFVLKHAPCRVWLCRQAIS